jgi:predicted ATPase
MLTRIYIDNYKCFSNLEFALGPLQLLLGANGTGKSTVLDVVFSLQRLLTGRAEIEVARSQTRWETRTRQTFEIDVQRPSDQATFRYHLELESNFGKPSRKIAAESLACNQVDIYRSEDGTAEFFTGNVWKRVLVSETSSGIPLLPNGHGDLDWFRQFVRQIVVLRPSPTTMGAAPAKEEEDYLKRDGSNFVGWYRGLEPQQLFEDKQRLHDKLRETLSGFESLRLLKTGEQERSMTTIWRTDSGKESAKFELGFDELSDGQRMLILLYTLATLSTGPGPVSILLDEPTNFVSLAEIEPWLRELEEHADEGKLQAIVVSHNSEVLDAWTGAYGIRFTRNAAGPTRIERAVVDADDPLTPSERIARGWDDEDA